MLLNVVGCLPIDVLVVAVTFVHELAVQHLGGGTNLMSGSVQLHPQKLDMASFFAFGENICRHRRSLDPSEARLVAGQALLDHAELNSETFVLRRLTRSGAGSGESICQALAIVYAQSFSRLEMVFVFSTITQVHRTALGTCQCVPDQWRRLHTHSSYLTRAAC